MESYKLWVNYEPQFFIAAKVAGQYQAGLILVTVCGNFTGEKR